MQLGLFLPPLHMIISCKVSYKYLFIAVLVVIALYRLTVQAGYSVRNGSDFFIPLTYPRPDSTPIKQKPVQQKKPAKVPIRRDTAVVAISKDTIPQQKDTITTGDSSLLKDSVVQRVDTFSIKMSKDSLDAPVDFEAEDSMVIDIPGEKVYLYNNAKVKFKDISLDASVIQLEQPTQILTAYYTLDSVGKRSGIPAFKQGESAFTSDTIRYNFKTQRGLTVGTYTQEEEMFMYLEKSKRISPTVFFGAGARFTSCNYDTPHFAFRTKKLKLISGKMAVTGFVRPEFEGVPIPIGLPFGLFPLKQGRRTGLLPPQPVANDQLGFGLEGLGYYKTFGDYWDATIRANIYSYGSYNLFLTPSYRKRYRYSGSLNLSYMNNKIGFKGDPDYRPPSRNFALQWNHSVDGKARPGTTFSSNVNIATSLFNRFFPGNAQQNFNNQLNSSIAYQKSWAGKPFNLTVSANHNQNTFTRLFNVNLPDVGFTVNTIYPLQRKNFVGAPKWYEKLGVAYNGTFTNSFAFYDSAISMRQLLDTFEWKARHSIPIQLSLPPLGPLQIGPAISYNEIWHSVLYLRSWNNNSKILETKRTKGFFREKQMSFGLNFSTALFGIMKFKRKQGLQAIRHVVRPTLGMSYVPDLNKDNFYRMQVDSLGNQYWFDKLNGSSLLLLPDRRSANISFTLDNNLEMKVKSKKDTSEAGLKKIRLIDGFGFTGGYNILRDSFNLTDFTFYLRSNLFEKINLTAGANVSPYQQDKNGRLINKYTWQGDKFSPGRFTSGFVSLSTSFHSKPKDEKREKEKEKYMRDQQENFGELTREMANIQRNQEEFADFNIPWSINLAYSLQLTRQPKRNFSGFETQLTQSINFGGDFNLTEKWKIQANGNYDITTKKLQYLTTSIARDLHCWQLAINVTPLGIYRSFSITINPKSGLLRDLRINRTRFFYDLPQF